MSLNNIIRPSSQVQTSQGAPLAGGLIYLYEPGTTTFISSYKDSGLVTPNVSPVPLSSSGRANVWITRNCDMFITDRNGNNVLQELSANPDQLGVDVSGGLVPNGSFELDTDADTIPDGWTLTSSAGATNARDNTTSTDGAWSERFTSSGVGGGTLTTTDFFPVTDLTNLQVSFDIKGSVLGPNNRVRVEWYDISFVSISNTDAYNATNTPTTFTNFALSVVPPANARFAKLKLIGIDPSVPFAASTWFDRISVFYPAVVSGVFNNITITGNSIISTNTNGAINIVPNGTGTVREGTGSIEWPKYSADALGTVARFEKSRSAVDGTQTIVVAQDELGTLKWQGSDGTAFRDAASIAGAVDGTPGANDMPGRLVFSTSFDGTITPGEVMRVTNAGTLDLTERSVAYATPLGTTNHLLNLQGTGAVNSVSMQIARYVASPNGPSFALAHSRGATLGSNVAVVDADVLGSIFFRGWDGTTTSPLSHLALVGEVDGTPAVGSRPGRLNIQTTPSGATLPVTKIRISANGQVAFMANGATYNQVPLTIGGSNPATVWQGIAGKVSISVDQYTADAVAGAVVLRKTRGASMNAYTVVSSADSLGSLQWFGGDGTGFTQAADISVFVDAGAGLNDMPGRMVFSTTADAGSTPLERLRIDSTGIMSLTSSGATYAVPASLFAVFPKVAIQGPGVQYVVIDSFSNSSGSYLALRQSKSVTNGAHTIVVSGDAVGGIEFQGSDGSTFRALARIEANVDGTPGASDMPGRLAFWTTLDGTSTALERMRVSNNGQVTITGGGGTYAAPPNVGANAPFLVIQGTANVTQTVDVYSASQNSSIALRRSRNATIGGQTIVANNDAIGAIEFHGSNGSTFDIGAQIYANVDGTPGASNDMPMRLGFFTAPDATASPVEHMRIKADGQVSIWETGQAVLRNAKMIAPRSGANQTLGNLDIFGYMTNTQTSSITTFADITDLSGISNLEVNTNYAFEAYLEVNASSTGGAKFAFTFTQTPIGSGYVCEFSGAVVTTTVTQQTMVTAAAIASSGSGIFGVRLRGRFKTHATIATTLALQFAQNTAVGTSTIQIGANIVITKLGV
jgi:hypothetical protein